MTVLVGGPCAGRTVDVPGHHNHWPVRQGEHVGVYLLDPDRQTAVWQGWGTNEPEGTT